MITAKFAKLSTDNFEIWEAIKWSLRNLRSSQMTTSKFERFPNFIQTQIKKLKIQAKHVDPQYFRWNRMKTMQVQQISMIFPYKQLKNTENASKTSRSTIFSMKPHENHAKSTDFYDFSIQTQIFCLKRQAKHVDL